MRLSVNTRTCRTITSHLSKGKSSIELSTGVLRAVECGFEMAIGTMGMGRGGVKTSLFVGEERSVGGVDKGMLG